jgi:hypothetical protein
MYSRSAKGGEKGDPNRNPWLAKMINIMIFMELVNFAPKKVSNHSCHFQLSNIRITKRFRLAGDDDYLRGATSINHQVALHANFKMYSRSAKGGEKGDPNRNPWLAKMNVYMVNRSYYDLFSEIDGVGPSWP